MYLPGKLNFFISVLLNFEWFYENCKIEFNADNDFPAI